MCGTLARLLGPWGALGAALAACATPLPERKGTAGGDRASAEAGLAAGVTLRFDPPAPIDAITPVTRVFADFGQVLADPRVLVVSGALTVSQMRDLTRPAVPQTLTDRQVSALAWTDRASAQLVVAPLVTLDKGGQYTIGVSAPPAALAFTIESAEPQQPVPRLWPDHEEKAPLARAAVWCAPGELALPVDAAVTFDPAGVAGRFAPGTGAPIDAKRCVSWLADATVGDAGAAPAVAPPAVDLVDGQRALLEPTLLWSRDGADPERGGVVCSSLQVPFGLGCAEVQDDRIIVTPPNDPVLWTIDPGVDVVVRATRDAKRFVVRPMPVDATYRVATLERAGRSSYDEVQVTPGAPRAHLVINEVLANPAGAEPAQEWVELYNDGLVAISLAGFGLDDTGGHTVLPDSTLDAKGFALVVGPGFVENDGVDPPPAPGALIVRVPLLGKGGLSNDGETVVLRDPSGAVVSSFPAVKTKNGVSVARIAPDALDDDPGAFEMSSNGSATPGGPNRPP